MDGLTICCCRTATANHRRYHLRWTLTRATWRRWRGTAYSLQVHSGQSVQFDLPLLSLSTQHARHAQRTHLHCVAGTRKHGRPPRARGCSKNRAPLNATHCALPACSLSPPQTYRCFIRVDRLWMVYFTTLSTTLLVARSRCTRALPRIPTAHIRARGGAGMGACAPHHTYRMPHHPLHLPALNTTPPLPARTATHATTHTYSGAITCHHTRTHLPYQHPHCQCYLWPALLRTFLLRTVHCVTAFFLVPMLPRSGILFCPRSVCRLARCCISCQLSWTLTCHACSAGNCLRSPNRTCRWFNALPV